MTRQELRKRAFQLLDEVACICSALEFHTETSKDEATKYNRMLCQTRDLQVGLTGQDGACGLGWQDEEA